MRARTDESFVPPVQNIVINIPPRSSKSTLVSVFFPAWVWLRDASLTFRCLSANPRVSTRDSRDWREVVGSPWYAKLKRALGQSWDIKPNEDALGHAANTRRGVRDASGLNANIIGEGADVLIIDDPHDLKELNDFKRQALLDRYDQGVHNRVNDPIRCLRILIMQRLHQDDLSGHLLASGDWEHLLIPMEYDPERARVTAFGWHDPRTEVGELLHPERFPRDYCDRERKRLGPYGYAGQMDQSPSIRSGGLFPRGAWRFWKPDGVAEDHGRPIGCDDGPARPLPAEFDRVVMSYDSALRQKTSNDYDVITTWAVKDADLYLVDHERGRWDTPTAVERIKAARMRVEVKLGCRVSVVLIEGRAKGDSVAEALEHQIGSVVRIDPKGSKQERAAAVQGEVLGGNVHLQDGAPWLVDFIDEAAMFPLGRHDDQVDTFSMAANWIRENRPAPQPPPGAWKKFGAHFGR